jgi:hypothetical protein
MSYAVVSDPQVHAIFRRLTEPYLVLVGNRVLTEASLRCNVRTGTLRSSLYLSMETLGFKVGSTMPYALFVHEGTRPHVIRPNTARALRFEAAGGVRFAQKVNHPGYRGNPFLREAMEAVVGSL